MKIHRIALGPWRWPVTLGVPLLITAGLFLSGVVHPRYEAIARLGYWGPAKRMEIDLRLFKSEPVRLQPALTYSKVLNQGIIIEGHGRSRSELVRDIHHAAEAFVQR